MPAGKPGEESDSETVPAVRNLPRNTPCEGKSGTVFFLQRTAAHYNYNCNYHYLYFYFYSYFYFHLYF